MMRGEIFKQWNIIAATLFSVVLIGGAYVVARGVESPPIAQASTETALLQAIASKDSDGDGLPDWEESLYGTDSHVTDTFHLGMTDGEAVAKGLVVPKAIADMRTGTMVATSSLSADGLPPAAAEGTLTATFAQSFFELFLAAKEKNGGGDLSESQMSDVADQTMKSFVASLKATPDFKRLSDISLVQSTPESLKTFAAEAEAVLMKNTTDSTLSDIEYFKLAAVDGDASAYGHIVSIAKGYRDSAAGIAALKVPQDLAPEALRLTNALMRLSEIDTDFTKTDTDPLVAILALQQYQTVLKSMQTAFINIGMLYATAHMSLAPGTPGALFVNMIADIDKEQQSAKKI